VALLVWHLIPKTSVDRWLLVGLVPIVVLIISNGGQ